VDFNSVIDANGNLLTLATQVRRAVAWVYRNATSFGGDPHQLYVSGVSSGGHLASVVLMTDWQKDFSLPIDTVKGGLCASGMYDLYPVSLSARSNYVTFTGEVVEALSARRHVERFAAPVIIAHGTLETPEFQRQSREFAAALKSAGRTATLLVGEGYNHFELHETLGNPYGLLGRAVLEQMKLKEILVSGASTQTTVNAEIAPGGKLRVGMNASNSTLVSRAADGSVTGLSVDLGRFIAENLGASFEPVVYASPATYTQSFGGGEWDIIVTGRNASAAKTVDFTDDVIVIDFVFVAAPGHAFPDADRVDRTGVTIAVAGNASADVFLSRTLKSARLVRSGGDTAAAIDLLRTGKADMYATVTDNALAIARAVPGATIVPGTFTTVGFAVATPKGLSPAAQTTLGQIIKQAKAAGIVQQAIDKAGLKGVRVAP
jgi:ABC-type amino acid transport substrate-binding protein